MVSWQPSRMEAAARALIKKNVAVMAVITQGPTSRTTACRPTRRPRTHCTHCTCRRPAGLCRPLCPRKKKQLKQRRPENRWVGSCFPWLSLCARISSADSSSSPPRAAAPASPAASAAGVNNKLNARCGFSTPALSTCRSQAVQEPHLPLRGRGGTRLAHRNASWSPYSRR